MATYDVELRGRDGDVVVRGVEADDGYGAIWLAQMDYFSGGRAKLVAAPCPTCLDSGIERQPSFDSETNAARRLICECEWGQALLRDRGPDNFTTTTEPDQEAEIRDGEVVS